MKCGYGGCVQDCGHLGPHDPRDGSPPSTYVHPRHGSVREAAEYIIEMAEVWETTGVSRVRSISRAAREILALNEGSASC